jgi:uncharacterized protein YcaQ
VERWLNPPPGTRKGAVPDEVKPLDQWVNRLLDERLDDEFIRRQRASCAAEVEDFVRWARPWWIADSIKKRDIERLVELTEDVDARRMAFERLFPPRGRPRKADQPRSEKGEDARALANLIRAAARDVDYLLGVLAAEYGRQEHGVSELAVKIVAERYRSMLEGMTGARAPTETQITQHRHDNPTNSRT